MRKREKREREMKNEAVREIMQTIKDRMIASKKEKCIRA